MHLDEVSIIITGGARGIGAATARLFAAGGAQVMIADLLDEEGQALAEELGPKVRYHRLNVTEAEDWSQVVAATEAAFGKVNALFNNAGTSAFGSVVDSSVEDFRRVMDVNVTGVFLGIKAAAPAIKRAGGGAIVNASSAAGIRAQPGIAAYVASKFAVTGLTKAAALELGRDGVRVVSIHPGPINTPMTKDFPRDAAAVLPIPRFGEPEEIAALVRFLVCEAGFATGSEWVLDGGNTTGRLPPVAVS